MYILLFFSPINWKIVDSESFPKIGYFLGDSVDDMGDFVADDEFYVLIWNEGYFGRNFVTHEQSIFDFDRSWQKFLHIFLRTGKITVVLCFHE